MPEISNSQLLSTHTSPGRRGSVLMVADPLERVPQNRKRFIELMGGDNGGGGEKVRKARVAHFKLQGIMRP